MHLLWLSINTCGQALGDFGSSFMVLGELTHADNVAIEIRYKRAKFFGATQSGKHNVNVYKKIRVLFTGFI